MSAPLENIIVARSQRRNRRTYTHRTPCQTLLQCHHPHTRELISQPPNQRFQEVSNDFTVEERTDAFKDQIRRRRGIGYHFSHER